MYHIKHREAYDVLSEMHHLFLISPSPLEGRIQRGKPSAIFSWLQRWKNEEDGGIGYKVFSFPVITALC